MPQQSNQDDKQLIPQQLKHKKTVLEPPRRKHQEELLNMWSHALAAIFGVVGAGYLALSTLESGEAYALEAALIYGATILLLFGASASYHGVVDVKLKRKLRIVDHCAIFLFIAGNYTPLLLLKIGGELGFYGLIMQWAIASIGVLLKIKFTGRYDWFFILLFVIMAWSGVMYKEALYQALSVDGFTSLIVGGVVYMVGIIFYKSESKIPYAHLIWHFFVMVGCAIHYYMFLYYVFI